MNTIGYKPCPEHKCVVIEDAVGKYCFTVFTNIWVSGVQCLNSQHINIFKNSEHLKSSFHSIRDNVHFHYNGTNANEINVLTMFQSRFLEF